jgi:peptidoglycan-associated lipoprotein
MRTPRVVLTAAVVVLALMTAASCTKKKPETTPQTPTATEQPAPEPAKPTEAAEPFPNQQIEKAPVTEPTIDALNRQGVLQTVHFAYDSNALDDAARSILQANADWLKGHTKYTVEIAGHCDERGSIGYNVALGDRRASAVRDYLVSLGADGSKLTTVSYGKERPIDSAHNAAAWATNRRAEFTIKP